MQNNKQKPLPLSNGRREGFHLVPTIGFYTIPVIDITAQILHNYAGKPAAEGSLSGVGKHDDWAAGALRWCTTNGILTNVPFTNATETATRAQTAQLLMNYMSR